MKLAVIENSPDFQGLLKEAIKICGIEVSFFPSAEEFGKVSLRHFQVIVADHQLPGTNGTDLLRAVHFKTKAHLALMSSTTSVFKGLSGNEEYIAGLLDKGDLSGVVDWIKWADCQIRLTASLERDEIQYNHLSSVVSGIANGFRIEQKEGVLLLGLSQFLSKESKAKVTKTLAEADFRAVFYFTEKMPAVQSDNLGQLSSFWQKIRRNRGRMAIFAEKDSIVFEQLQICNLDKVMKIFNSMSEAQAYVQK